VPEAGVIVSQAMLVAIGIDWDGRRQVLAVELAHRESRSSWRDFLLGLKRHGLGGIQHVYLDMDDVREHKKGRRAAPLEPRPVQRLSRGRRSTTVQASWDPSNSARSRVNRRSASSTLA
jgi:hypothetical protein